MRDEGEQASRFIDDCTPPATCRASSLVLTAVLFLALAGAADAFTVEIVLPSTNTWLVATDRPQAFEAVAYDGQQEITEQVTWSWDFDDGSAADTDNPTEHAYETAGDYTVTVTATWSAQQEQDQISLEAQEPNGAFVLARAVAGGYQTLEDDEVCHTRYLIAFDAVPRYYDGVNFWRKYEWQQDFGSPTLVYPSQQIVLDGQQRNEAWVVEWTTSECPGQAVAGEFNAQVDWKIAGQYIDWQTMEPADELIGVPSYTINNTVVSSPAGVLLFDPDDEELDSCEISWTTTHQNVYSVKFSVPIHIYDLDRNELYTYTKTNVPLGNDSWVWDGTITPQEPEGPEEATKGIYTYRVGVVGSQGTCGGVRCACTGEMSCARGDWDKSAFLEITNVSVTDFAWSQTRYPDYAFVVLHYTLTSGASDVEVRCYKPDLTETAIDDPETFPCTAGTHNVLVEFAVDREVMGPYRFVISADECAVDAANNRAKDTKPALQMGATQVIWPPAEGLLGGDIAQSPQTLAEVVSQMGAVGVDDTCYAASSDTSHTAYAAREALRTSAVLFLYAHSTPTKMSFDNGAGSGVHDLLGGTGTDSPGDDNYYVANIPEDLDHVLFALCAGCESAGSGSWSTGSVPAAIVAKGAKSAIGFLDEIQVGPTWTFAHEFFKLTQIHISVDSAASAALYEVWRVHGAFGGTDSRARGGANVDLRPARFGAP